MERNIRFYMGRHKIRIIKHAGKKALIEHLEDGYVGNKREGCKQVLAHDHDVCLIRHCNYIQKFRGVRKNNGTSENKF